MKDGEKLESRLESASLIHEGPTLTFDPPPHCVEGIVLRQCDWSMLGHASDVSIERLIDTGMKTRHSQLKPTKSARTVLECSNVLLHCPL